MIDKINNELDAIDKQLIRLQTRKAHLIEQRSKYKTENLQPGMKVRIIYDEWDGWGPNPGSIQYVHDLTGTHLYVGSKNKRSGTFWTSYDNIVLIKE